MSAASLPSTTRSYADPASAALSTTAAISAAMSAGPIAVTSASTRIPAPAPNAIAERIWSVASDDPTLSTVTDPSPASATRMASSTAHESWSPIV